MHRGREQGHTSSTAKSANKVEILHDGQIPEAAHRAKDVRANEQGLIAVRQAEPARSQIGPPGDQPQRRRLGVDLQLKRAADNRRAAQRPPNRIETPAGQPRVGMKKEQDRAGRDRRPGVELTGSAARGINHSVHRAVRDSARRRVTAAVGDNDFDR